MLRNSERTVENELLLEATPYTPKLQCTPKNAYETGIITDVSYPGESDWICRRTPSKHGFFNHF